MGKRLAARPGILGVRREAVEHSFGSIKRWMNQGALLMRGLDKVRAEFRLTALAYNLRPAITIIGNPGMIRACRPDLNRHVCRHDAECSLVTAHFDFIEA